MEKPYLTAKIVEVLGEIWGQDAVLELSDGQKIRVFDDMSACKIEMVGVSKVFEIHICFPAVIKTQQREKKIVPTEPIPKSGEYDVICEVLDVVEEKGEQEALIVDIGVGTIEVGLDRAEYEYEIFIIGDYVGVSGGRVDLREIIGVGEA